MPRLYGLDALRGLAAIIVMGGHIGSLPESGIFPGSYGLCVDFFLMLSGYILTRTYEERMRSGMGAVSFMAKRYRRLFPVAAIGAVLALLMTALAADGSLSLANWAAFATALLFLPYPEQWLFPLNGPRWSLFGELCVNLLHVTGLSRLSVRNLVIVLFLVLAAQIVLMQDLGRWPVLGHAPQFVPGMLRMIVAYTIGILLWRCVGDRRLIVLRMPSLVIIFAAMVYVGGLFHPVGMGLAAVFLICPLLVLGGASYQPSPRLAAWCGAAGALSYPLYATHEPLLQLAVWGGLAPLQILLIALATVGALVAGLALWARRSSGRIEAPVVAR
jgi:peptidoglycan/LPS O-acetylase OafA/YrhL